VHHRLLIPRLVVSERARVLLQGLANARDIPVAKDAPAARKEGLLHAIAGYLLVLDIGDDRLGRRESDGGHAAYAPLHHMVGQAHFTGIIGFAGE